MSKQLTRRAFPLIEIKTAEDGQGTFSGYLATYDDDLQGDRIQPGAFAKTLGELQKKQQGHNSRYMLPILWGHDQNDPIGGFVSAREDTKGLYVEGELDLDIEQGRRAYSGIKRGYAGAMSIGYYVVKQGFKDGVRLLQEIALLEGSITATPANPEAVIMNVKNQQQGASGEQPQTPAKPDRKAMDFDTAYTTERSYWELTRELDGLLSTLRKAVLSVLVEGANSDGDNATLATSLEQFGARLTAWVQMAEMQECWEEVVETAERYGEDPLEYMSAVNIPGMEQKAGRMMSASNHNDMGTALGEMDKALKAAKAQHKALADLHARMAPKEPSDAGDAGELDTQKQGGKSARYPTTPGAGAGAGRHADDTTGAPLAGNTTPQQGETTPEPVDPLSEAVREKIVRLKAAMLTHNMQDMQKVSA